MTLPNPARRRRLSDVPAGAMFASAGLLSAATLLTVATGAVLTLGHRADRQDQAEVALARVSHLADAVRFQPAGFVHGVPISPADLADNAALRDELAGQAAALARLSPVGGPIRAAALQLHSAGSRELGPVG